MNASGVDVRDALFAALYRVMARDESVVLLSADQGAFGLGPIRRDFPTRFRNVGVAEQNLVNVAAGLALGGKRVFGYGIVSFLTGRALDQIRVALCGMGLPVTLLGSGAGLCYGNDGPSHHGSHDLALLRALPGLSIWSPSDATTTELSVEAAYQSGGPAYVRSDKGVFEDLHRRDELDWQQGVCQLEPGRDALVLSTGFGVHHALALARALRDAGSSVGVVDVWRIDPLDEGTLLKLVAGTRRLVTLEEHSAVGGLGSAIAELVCDHGLRQPVRRLALRDTPGFVYGRRSWMQAALGLDPLRLVRDLGAWIRGT